MKFTKVDESIRESHHHLEPSDNCIFLHEYTSGAGYNFSQANQLIFNLKKKPSLRHTAAYKYKMQAISRCSSLLRNSLNPEWLKNAVLVPVPGSKALEDPDYDDRMEQICNGILQGVDVRNIVRQTESTIASHEGSSRNSIPDLLNVYEIDEDLTANIPDFIGIVDDVLTTGTHFKAMQSMLSQRFPEKPITGIFIARVVRPAQDGPF